MAAERRMARDYQTNIMLRLGEFENCFIVNFRFMWLRANTSVDMGESRTHFVKVLLSQRAVEIEDQNGLIELLGKCYHFVY